MISVYVELITDILNEIINAIIAAVKSKAFWIVLGIIAAILIIVWLTSGMEFREFFSVDHAKEVFFGGRDVAPEEGEEPAEGQGRDMPER